VARDEAGRDRSTVETESRRARRLGWCFAALCAVLGATLRIHAALTDPGFDRASSKGMLRSDPGLLYYFTERIVESRGLPPDDFRADPRVEHPDTTDVPATFTIGQEFVVAWGYLLSGARAPLHVFCVWIMGIWASLAALAVYGLARELACEVRWAALAAALYTAMPANYRTVGWILMSEDFSIPWFALHLWLLARAARVRTPASILLASLALAAAVSTWHATLFFAALEAACVFAWFQRTGRNPIREPGAWILPAVLIAASAVVPVLRSTVFALSLPMQIVLALWVASAWRARGERLVAWLALGTAAGASILASKLRDAGAGEYGHVFALIFEKIRHLGRLPEDPSALPAEARWMWQGPFATLDPSAMLRLLGLRAHALIPAVRVLARSIRDGAQTGAEGTNALACALAILAIPVAWLVERTIILPGLLLPAVGAAATARIGGTSRARGIAAGLGLAAVLLQAWSCAQRIESTPNPWYRPRQREEEIAELVTQIPSLVPEGEAIAADFMTSTAILAQTGHPILFQPKWESRRSRERTLEMFEAFYEKGPAELRRLLLDRYRCRYLVVDRSFFGIQRSSWYAAGLVPGQARPGTCADLLLSRDAGVLAGVPGFRLLYRSPDSIRFADGDPTDFYRLYRLDP
jgi:hypothetical protein